MIHYNDMTAADKVLADLLPYTEIADQHMIDTLTKRNDIPAYTVFSPNAEYGFLHEGAVIAYKGVLFAAWYNCEKVELAGNTPIRFARSFDDGKTWTQPETMTPGEEGILYCPPIFGIDEGRLYVLLNEMVGPDRMHALDLYLWNEAEERFELLWSRPIPFKLNTNVVHLANGKLLLPGRIAKLDGFPNTPAVLISDAGRMDSDWRLVYIQPNGDLPDGSAFVHPEICPIVDGNEIRMFSRNDDRNVPIWYRSADFGETWSEPLTHNIPFASSKLYSGTLSDGRSYLIGNIRPHRSRLAIFFTEPGGEKFTKGFFLQDGYSEALGYGGLWHYPCAYEDAGKLYVVYTDCRDGDWSKRGLTMSVVDIADI